MIEKAAMSLADIAAFDQIFGLNRDGSDGG
jgi:hypothetical protein